MKIGPGVAACSSISGCRSGTVIPVATPCGWIVLTRM